MEFIKGVTFGAFASRGSFETKEAYSSLDSLKERLDANYIILVPNSLQETPQSEEITFTSKATVSDEELIKFIQYAHEIGFKVALKPTVNCKNGTWRAHINFFDKDVKCEPKWCNWFASYTQMQLHFAKIAEETKCELFVVGCEMVMSERREQEWRKLVSDVRTVYNGPITYNTDKYQEDNVHWWDCLDIISSSGYYPIGDWEQELDRIEGIVKKYNKPFFFSECGCRSVEGASQIPNSWQLAGDVNLQEQVDWYTAMFEACRKRDWVEGFGIWDWSWKQYPEHKASTNCNYDIYCKPVEKIVQKNYSEL